MKCLTFALIVLLSFVTSVCAAAEMYAAERFAKDYEQQLESEGGRVRINWDVVANTKLGVAVYEEEEQGIDSEFSAFYGEGSVAATLRTDNDFEIAAEGSFGQSATDTEEWYIGSIKYQTNDLDFYRAQAKGSIGKVFRLDNESFDGMEITPFIGYGFRYINFERTNFNILNLVTSREVVTEKFYIHHGDVGIKLSQKLNEKFSIEGVGLFGYVFHNEADNNVLGTIEGGGGFIAEGLINLEYALSDCCKLKLGGFAEYQDLKGATKDSIIWPDNTLGIYGGIIAVRFVF